LRTWQLAACCKATDTSDVRWSQINYVRAQEQQNIFPANTPLTLVPTYTYDFDSSGNPTTLPPADACTVRRPSDCATLIMKILTVRQLFVVDLAAAQSVMTYTSKPWRESCLIVISTAATSAVLFT